MDFKFVICDDERSQRDYLKKFVSEWGRMHLYALDIKEFDSAEAFLFNYEADPSVDILLLDIQMKQMDGVTLAKFLRLKTIIFKSSSSPDMQSLFRRAMRSARCII